MAKHPPYDAVCSCPICVPGKPYSMASSGPGYVQTNAPQPDPQGARIRELERELANAKTLWARSIEQVGEEQTERLRVAAERDRLRRALEAIAEPAADDEVPDESDIDAAERWFKIATRRKKAAREALSRLPQAALHAQAQRDVIAAAGTALLAWAKNEGIFPAMSALKQRYDALDALESGGG